MVVHGRRSGIHTAVASPAEPLGDNSLKDGDVGGLEGGIKSLGLPTPAGAGANYQRRGMRPLMAQLILHARHRTATLTAKRGSRIPAPREK